MDGQTILVTGATDGIGRGAAMAFARGGAKVLVHGRDADRLEVVRDEIRAATGAACEAYRADFASLAEVRRMAEAVAADHPVIHVLLNNAGIGRGPKGGQVREVSADGHELRFQVNHLAPLLLARALLDNLRRAKAGRIVNVASAGQMAIDFDDPMLERGYDGRAARHQDGARGVRRAPRLGRDRYRFRGLSRHRA
jgi:NAD(P)-dependent dehydrogenase (short-subunit alcohol dehydrogenase family)